MKRDPHAHPWAVTWNFIYPVAIYQCFEEMSSSKQSIPFILSVTLLGIYLSTTSPVVYLGDSGELTAAAFSLGIPHNSGYPLYALVGKLFCLIPFGNVGFRMNLMSIIFAVLTAWLVYSIIHKITSSVLSSFLGAFILAFSPLFWSQTVSAEVYPLHTFFVTLLIKLLWWWDEKRDFPRLVLLVFVTGISFGNHLQTVMLAPGVLFIILTADKKVLFDFRHFAVLTIFFLFALTLYLYLPIRTNAGAAIHWGDPNTLERFIEHVTATSHRQGYIFNKTPWEYLLRAKEALRFVGVQYGIFLFFALWGWLKFHSHRWRIFWGIVIVFDFFYTLFLNTISLEITPFTLPTCIVLAILIGTGLSHAIRWVMNFPGIRLFTKRIITITSCIIPVFPFLFNRGLCDQSRNYTAYEQALNIYRTLSNGSILFLDGDNNIFPVLYGRVVEGMREDVRIYDRHNIFYKMPYLGERKGYLYGKWEEVRAILEKEIIEKMIPYGVFFAVFNPFAVSIPEGYFLIPYGILSRVVEGHTPLREMRSHEPWMYYSKESFYQDFERDYMNRQVCAYYYFNKGKYFFSLGKDSLGLKHFELASRIGYDDTSIHSDIAIFLIDRGYFKEALGELEKAKNYYEDLSGIHNNWGYYYLKIGDYEKAIVFFQKAIGLKPDEFGYYNNLAFTFYKIGKKDKALLTFQRSLDINKNQPKVRKFMKEHGLIQDNVFHESFFVKSMSSERIRVPIVIPIPSVTKKGSNVKTTK